MTMNVGGAKNAGIVNSKGDGFKMKEAYGKNDSDVAGSAGDERRTDKFGGGVNNLAHSLSGASANQKGT